MNARLSLVVLALSTLVGCTDEKAQGSDAAIVDAGPASSTDAGADAAIDGGLLGCMEADTTYFTAIRDDSRLRQLGACTRDEDCVVWRPDLMCSAIGLQALSCGAGTRADQVDASYARRDEIASSLCPHIEPTCRIGVTCAPGVVARCNLGTCATTTAADAGTDGG